MIQSLSLIIQPRTLQTLIRVFQSITQALTQLSNSIQSNQAINEISNNVITNNEIFEL